MFSIDRVALEILAGDDEWVEWVKHRREPFFLKPDATVLASLARVSAWATSGDFEPSAATTLLDAADSYLVAHAHAHGHVVVTHERPAPSRRTIKVPNACVEMGVPYVNTFEMLRSERARFLLVGSAR